ncbi:formylmethanofuran dehydrogenase [Burkholderia sp. WSM2230]|uniref:formylmethanofuran dehydrogenase n=1 Tax=Burkholderia sp. WSM2230 TaxID=944435 RepID=UPI0004718715|nr:formylmethanofuran dehydrogenase [Burkholderia sp. WSM2230]
MHLSPTDPSTTSPSGAAHAPASSIARDWTCPFCPLLCDDLAMESHGDATLVAQNTDCPRLMQALACYGADDARCRASIDGHDADFDAALARAAHILSTARRPLFGGLATDVAGARALYTLAAGCGAILDHQHGDALSAATLALQDRGSFFTTLSEVRSRADLLLFFGCQPSRRYPRFFTRTVEGMPTPRELVFIGCEADPAASRLENVRVESILADADAFDPFDTLALWSTISDRRPPTALHQDVANAAEVKETLAVLQALQARIDAARYTVLVYEPAALPAPHAALLIEALNRIVKASNLSARAGGLALGGDDGALTVNQTVTWLSGLPLRTRVSGPARRAGSAPLDYDPYRYRTESLLADGEIDALLWVASFAPPAWPQALADDVPAIVLGHPALAQMAAARGKDTVFIPVATPGVDSGGHLFRVDSSVVMPLAAARGTGIPSVATVAAQLAALLCAPGSDAGPDIQPATPSASSPQARP